mmetsp:Transcript_17961/g.50268  ORF Transcript_17961/g.50268 Transcript_17961/m.50268 type:complete len:221 (+) Transcript_17961:2480-3142(+)
MPALSTTCGSWWCSHFSQQRLSSSTTPLCLQPWWSTSAPSTHLWTPGAMSLKTRTIYLTKKRIWGALLGEAKKAIERSIDLGYQDGLYATLKGFSTATGDSASTGAFETGEALTTLVVRNPDVVRGKGRPKMTIRVRVATGKRLENSRQPLHELANRGSRAASMEGDGTPRADSGGASAGAGSAPISSAPARAPPAKRLRKCVCCGKHPFHSDEECPQRE